MNVKKLKFTKEEIKTLGILSAVTCGIWYYGKQSLKNSLQQQGYAYLNPDNKKLMPTTSTVQIVKENKQAELLQAENNTITTPASNLFDYNNPEYHAGVDYYLSQSTGTFYDDNGNKITVENDGTISIPVWSAVKEGLSKIFGGLL